MNTTPIEGFPDIEEYYQDLPPLDRSREVYLLTSIMTEEIDLAPRWNHYQESARRDYARNVGDYVNESIFDNNSPEEIENILVQHINSETQHRWLAYTARIDAADKEQEFADQLATDITIICDSEEKAHQIRESWRKYLESYGSTGAEFIADVRAEFVRNKVVWDTGKEILFLHAVLTTDRHQEAA